jgi:hypothetical protein
MQHKVGRVGTPMRTGSLVLGVRGPPQAGQDDTNLNIVIVIVILAPLLILVACSFSNARRRHSALQLPKNNKMLNVVCSLIDFGDTCIAIEPFGRVIGEIAITSEGLDRI